MLTQMDKQARVDVQSIDKAQQQGSAAQIEAANNAGFWRTRSSRAETQIQNTSRDHPQCGSA